MSEFGPGPEDGDNDGIDTDFKAPETGGISNEIETVEGQGLAALASELGFLETETMVSVRQEMIAATDEESRKEAYFRWRDLAEGQTPADPSGQIGLLIATANLFREAGDEQRVREELADAADYAGEIGNADLEQRIRSQLDAN